MVAGPGFEPGSVGPKSTLVGVFIIKAVCI
jgi:hypothetical protein